MADEDQDFEDTPVGGALGALLGGGESLTTTEAQSEARRILRRNVDQDPFEEQEKGLLGELDKSAEAARAALRTARANILKRRQRLAIPLLAASAALSKPTRTGAFSESIGNLSEGLIPVLQQRDELEATKQKDLLGIDSSLVGIDQDLIKQKLDLIAKRRTLQGPLSREALKILGKRTQSNVGAKPLSLFGKIALDEGLRPGTPDYQARVQELQAEDQANKRSASGRDSVEDTLEDRIEIANQYGLPVLKFDPFASLSTKGKQKAREIEQRSTDKKLAELEEGEADLVTQIQQADRYLVLNKKTTNGPIVGALSSIKGVNQEADAITAEITPLMRRPGSGSTSDFDAKMFKQAVFGRTKNASVNENIIKGFKAQRQRQLEKTEFFRNYGQVYNSLRGADAAWKEYLNANPIFNPKSPGTYTLNKDRKSYQEYFKSKNQEGFAEGGKVEFAEGGEVEAEEEPGSEAPLRLVQSAIQGGTFQTGDELTALLAKISGGEYDKALKEERYAQQVSEEENPLITKAAQGTGAAGLVAVGQAVAQRLGMSPQMIKLLPQGKLIQLALTGLSVGGASGAGAGEDDRGATAIESAILGTGGGILGGLGAKYGLLGLEEGFDKIVGRQIPAGEKRLANAFTKDELNPADLPGKVAARTRTRVPTTAGDVLGPEGKALKEAATLRGGQAADDATEALTKRLAGSRERVTDQVSRGLKADEYFGKLDDTIEELRKNAKPLYDAAYTKYPGINSPKLQELLDTPAGKKAIAKAFEKMQNAREPIGAVDVTGMVRKPSLKFFDYIKRALDDQVTKLQPKLPDSANIIRGLRNQLRDELDKLAPEYKTARAQYAGDLEVRDALTAGRDNFKSLTSEEVKRLTAGMSFAEKDVFRSGVAQSLFELINDPSTDINAARKLIGSPETTAKLEAIFEKPRDFKVFKAALEAEAEMFNRDRRTVNARERAQARRSGVGDSALERIDPALREIDSASPLRYVLNVLRRKTSMSEETADEIVKALQESDPAKLKELSERLTRTTGRLARRKARAGKAGILGAAAAGAMAAPSPKYQSEEDEDAEAEEIE